MKYIKIEMVVRAELASPIIDLVKGDVSSLTMSMVNEAKDLTYKRQVRSRRAVDALPASAACALEIIRSNGPDVRWTSSEVGHAMHATKGYAASGGSACVSYLIKEGLAARGDDGRVYATEKGWKK